MQNLILASSSPRRKQLLENLHLSFHVESSEVDETFDPALSPDEIVMELANRKAKAVFEGSPASFVIGADTIVVADGLVLGKPKDGQEAFDMLKKLSGKQHDVYTGVSIVSSHYSNQFFEKTKVFFWELTDEEIEAYVQTGEPLDKAGAYGIQDLGSVLVKKIIGDYFTVVGLPVSRTIRELKKAGYIMPFN